VTRGEGVRVKICGITTPEDAQAAARLGVDAIGLVFADSPRQVTVDQALSIIRSLPPFVTPVGVFVNSSTQEMMRIAWACGLGAVQLHGQEPPAACREPVLPVIKAIRVKTSAWVDLARTYEVSGLLLDTDHPEKAGGTGESFNWDLVQSQARPSGGPPIILAGGLNPENITQALTQVRPYGVDVSSGVEAAPGKKDYAKMEALVSRVRSYNG